MANESAVPENAAALGARTSAHSQLRHEIVTGLLPPGSLVHEMALSNRLGVSRAPIRDAILRLEADGLVERGPRGTVVRTRTADEIFDIYQARIALEAEAAATAASRASQLDLARLSMIHEEASTESDHARERQLHARWHSVLAAATRNQTIVELLERLTMQLAPYETAALADTPNLNHTEDEHSGLLSAIKAGDADGARRLMVAHLQRTRDVRVNALLRHEGGSPL
jgi:DNA-binding GntR family transcriptional regulator